MRASVSNIDLYRSWRTREESDFAWLLAALRNNEPTEDMLRGRAFARALERVSEGDYAQISQDGYTFVFTGEFAIEHYPRREESREKDYGGITVAARCDRVLGKLIVDDKTTGNFGRNDTGLEGSERYMEKFQWRFYLDMFGADRFKWNIWECSEIESQVYEVFALHTLEQYRYPDLAKDCTELAQEFRDFALKYLT